MAQQPKIESRLSAEQLARLIDQRFSLVRLERELKISATILRDARRRLLKEAWKKEHLRLKSRE